MVKQHKFKLDNYHFGTLDGKSFLDAGYAFGDIGPNSSATVVVHTTTKKSYITKGKSTTTTSIYSTVNGKVVYLGVTSMEDGNPVVFAESSQLYTTLWNLYPYKTKDANGKSQTVYGAFLYHAKSPGLNLAPNGSNLIVQKDPLVNWNIVV